MGISHKVFKCNNFLLKKKAYISYFVLKINGKGSWEGDNNIS
jgi:hypothetical protein